MTHKTAQHDSPSRVQRFSRVTARPSRRYRWLKRGLDIVVASVVLLASLPVLLVCAWLIKRADGGPVIYRQWRVGQNGWLFKLYKLRTMSLDAERGSGARFAEASDPRILPGCAWMRKSHVDELPQLWNVLLGQMSLVGPRPERPEIFESMATQLPRLEQRLAGKPGLTGLAQIRSGYSNDLAGMRRKLAYDLMYLRRRSIRQELALLLRTIPKVWDHQAL